MDELLQGLTHWDDASRRAACERLQDLSPLSAADRERVLEALHIRESDLDLRVRFAAEKALSKLQSQTEGT